MKTKITLIIVVVSLAIAILLPIVLTPWNIYQIEEAEITFAIVGFDPINKCFQTDRIFVYENKPPQTIVFSPIWNPLEEKITIDAPRLEELENGFYRLNICDRGEIAWGIVVVEVLFPLLSGGIVLLILKRKR